MSFFKRFSKLVSPPVDRNAYWVYVKCDRCGEKLQTRINLNNDLSINYGDKEGDDSYYCRKIIMGTGKCFERIEVELTFDNSRNVITQEIQGGKFISKEEFAENISTD